MHIQYKWCFGLCLIAGEYNGIAQTAASDHLCQSQGRAICGQKCATEPLQLRIMVYYMTSRAGVAC